jgi:hypothetical protein
LTIAFGVLFGQYVQRDYEKWHAQGRDAFLSFQGHRFDIYMANPSVGVFRIVVATFLVVGVIAIYEMIAYFAERCWLSASRGKTSTTPNS